MSYEQLILLLSAQALEVRGAFFAFKELSAPLSMWYFSAPYIRITVLLGYKGIKEDSEAVLRVATGNDCDQSCFNCGSAVGCCLSTVQSPLSLV